MELWQLFHGKMLYYPTPSSNTLAIDVKNPDVWWSKGILGFNLKLGLSWISFKTFVSCNSPPQLNFEYNHPSDRNLEHLLDTEIHLHRWGVGYISYIGFIQLMIIQTYLIIELLQTSVNKHSDVLLNNNPDLNLIFQYLTLSNEV